MSVPVVSREELLAFVLDENRQAKREVCVVRVPGPYPSGWDKRHAHLNDLLDDYLSFIALEALEV